jgi:putative membrane protein
MMVNNRGSTWNLLRWQWRWVLLFTLGGVVAAATHEVFALTWIDLPMPPLGVIGGAISIFVSFRTNSAYQRWWEGRQLWGRIVNSSRHWGAQTAAYVSPARAEALIRRQIVWVHTLRVALRDEDLTQDPELTRLLPTEERLRLAASRNPSHLLLHEQLQAAAALHTAGELDTRALQSMDETIRQLLDSQGGCERIKRTPMPRGYGFIAERLILIYGFLLPFGLVGELGWAAVPLNVVACLAFALISEAGRVLEDPFNLFYNGLPLSALSRTIEVNLTERLGDAPLLPLLKPDEDGILL